MKVVIVFNHPYEGSYCNAILQSAIRGVQQAGHEVDVMHLDKDGFNPVMSAEDLKAFVKRKAVDPQVLAYTKRLQEADHLVFIFPIWWELMPALTKGFIDKVIFPGSFYDHKPDRALMVPLMKKLKGVTVITTMNTPGFLYRFVFGNAIKKSLLRGTFWKTGYKNRKWINFSGVKFAKPEKREKWLKQVEERFFRLK